MKCKNCGTQFEEGIFCPECGTKYEEEVKSSINEAMPDNDIKQENITVGKKEEKKTKKKFPLWGKIVIGIFAFSTVAGMFLPSTDDTKKNEEVVAESEQDQEKVEEPEIELDYGSIYGGVMDYIVSEHGEDAEYLMYILHDMNNDGYKELIVENGTCNADVVYEVYTTDGEQSIYVGSIEEGYVSFYREENGNGIYTDYCQGGYEIIQHYTIEGDGLKSELVLEQQTENYGYKDGMAIEELKYPIESDYVVSFCSSGIANDNLVNTGLTYDLYTDVSNRMLYADTEGRIVDSQGNIIPEYLYLTALENGAISDGECILEGLEVSENSGLLVEYSVSEYDENGGDSYSAIKEELGLPRAGQYVNPDCPIIITIDDGVYSDGSSQIFAYINFYIGIEGDEYADEYTGMINLLNPGRVTVRTGVQATDGFEYNLDKNTISYINYFVYEYYYNRDIECNYYELPETYYLK